VTDSFILGLSSGSACLATCGMVMFPYLMAGSSGVRRIAIDLSLFLFTRFLVYLLLATASWYFGQAFFSNQLVRSFVPGVLYIVFAIMLVRYSISNSRTKDCPAKIVTTVNNKRLVPVFLGIVNSLAFCPALFLIMTKGATQGSLGQSGLSCFFSGFISMVFALASCGENQKKRSVKNNWHPCYRLSRNNIFHKRYY
jgi:hypothetical protein